MLWLLSILLALAAGSLAAAQTQVAGVVRDPAGPVAGAIVRVQTTSIVTTTDAQGRFVLHGVPDTGATLTATAPGYYVAGPVAARPGDAGVSFVLRKHAPGDNQDYPWLSAYGAEGKALNCQNCHSEAANPTSTLPFDEWVRDAHAKSAVNPRFLSVYNGNDLNGAAQPKADQPYPYGLGYKLDWYEVQGNCSACHAPAAAMHEPLGTNPNDAVGVGLEGVACDLCHKVWAVKLERSGLPDPARPGVLSFEFRRPPAGGQLFLGPYDDVATGEDSYSPLQKQSAFCAPCHYGRFNDVTVYDSFGEWLRSPYSDPVTGRTCQDCHMPARGATRVARGDKRARERDPKTIASHLMPGADDAALLRDTATLDLSAARAGGIVRVRATVVNAKAGHHIPTDHPARNILLVVTAADEQGHPLQLISGPTIPEWGGRGAEANDYAGQPGRGYAKVLEDRGARVAPTMAYWNPTRLVEDTRIPALGTDTSEYDFDAPAKGATHISARLIFRRAFKALAEQKGWGVPDIVMAETDREVR
jgi:hypothetical protein